MSRREEFVRSLSLVSIGSDLYVAGPRLYPEAGKEFAGVCFPVNLMQTGSELDLRHGSKLTCHRQQVDGWTTSEGKPLRIVRQTFTLFGGACWAEPDDWANWDGTDLGPRLAEAIQVFSQDTAAGEWVAATGFGLDYGKMGGDIKPADLPPFQAPPAMVESLCATVGRQHRRKVVLRAYKGGLFAFLMPLVTAEEGMKQQGSVVRVDGIGAGFEVFFFGRAGGPSVKLVKNADDGVLYRLKGEPMVWAAEDGKAHYDGDSPADCVRIPYTADWVMDPGPGNKYLAASKMGKKKERKPRQPKRTGPVTLPPEVTAPNPAAAPESEQPVPAEQTPPAGDAT